MSPVFGLVCYHFQSLLVVISACQNLHEFMSKVTKVLENVDVYAKEIQCMPSNQHVQINY